MNSPPFPPLCSAKRGALNTNLQRLPPLYEVERGIEGVSSWRKKEERIEGVSSCESKGRNGR